MLDTFFGDQSPLATVLPGFRARPAQREMAVRIAQAIESQETLCVEAGTGTGKTLAYLVPALLSGGKIIISTGTKTLQDQLFSRDIPAAQQALGLPITSAILKGRANYVCKLHLQQNLADARFASRQDSLDLQKIARFAARSTDGDRSGLSDVHEDAPAWHFAVSSRENCLGQNCSFHKECFVMEARKKALLAEVVVVNHHLFFADVMLRDEGVAELLPLSNTVIFDEAHQLPETASLFFGENLSIGQILDLVRDVRAESLRHAADCVEIERRAAAVEKAARDLRLVFTLGAAKFSYEKACGTSGFRGALDTLVNALAELDKVLETQAARAPELALIYDRILAQRQMLAGWRDEQSSDSIRWAETFQSGMRLYSTPLSVAQRFSSQLQSHARAWLFVSATLAVKNDFSLFQGEMGLDGCPSVRWESPFAFPEQALLYVPARMPAPNTPYFTQSVIDAALPVIEASGGSAFILCTSLRAMREAHSALLDAFSSRGHAFPLLVQGEGTRPELLRRFREAGNAVLVASHSFWEGIDVSGDALRVVVIDKLPFAPPDDPIVAARIEAARRAQRDPFSEIQLPRAALALKQGVGRLIRSETDYGVVMVGDTRLATQGYGRRMLAALPPMRRTRALEEVTAFFAQKQSRETEDAAVDA